MFLARPNAGAASSVDPHITIPLAIILALAIVGVMVYRNVYVWRRLYQMVRPETPLATKSFADFAKTTPSISDNPDLGEVSTLLSEQVGTLYEDTSQFVSKQQDRAGQILGFLGGGVGVVALISKSALKTTPNVTPGDFLTYLALASLVFALISCLVCSAGGRRRRAWPQLRQLASVGTLCDPETSKSRVAAYLFQLELDRYDQYLLVALYRSMWLERAQFSFGCGAIVFVLRLALPT